MMLMMRLTRMMMMMLMMITTTTMMTMITITSWLETLLGQFHICNQEGTCDSFNNLSEDTRYLYPEVSKTQKESALTVFREQIFALGKFLGVKT
eukprot:5039794-Karenia_brevis.AAC.1